MDSISETGALIIEAAATGDLKKLKAIRRKVGDDTDFRRICDEYGDFSTGWTVLHHAAEIGHFEICKFLIQNVQVYIDASTYQRDTPLIKAAKGEHVKLAEYLVNRGASISKANSKGFTALHYAIIKDNRELMELLLLGNAAIEADSVEGTPLQCAASRGNVEAVKLLLSHGAKPDLCFLVMDPPLVCAIKSRSFQCMDALLKARADPNTYYIGVCPLSFAAKEGDTRFLKSLLEAGADPNSLFTGDVKPIEDAALVHNREGVEILFPLTQQIKHYPEWTVDGIMDYCRSELAKTMREEDRSLRFTALEKGAHDAMSLKDYDRAIVYFRMANAIDPSNPKWASKRSLCHAHVDRRVHALYDAEECIRLEPQIPAPHDGDADAAYTLAEKFFITGLAFTLEPYDKAINDEFRTVSFDYFAWLYLMSSPEEIVSFTGKS
ncbi:uncharacterized protein LOC131016379 [Salvia miltiorrhiza]|uniref:uncharacterized protein LOC131016379 n=1 Tax=Salvia miltiorrhiza TaxID=226208 RepID=UPI0025AB9D5E|nr:uncharacterized protein LOC131016379 [Salvia miltiorrhiza]